MKIKLLLAAMLGSAVFSAVGAAEWTFPQDHGARINNVPDWGNKGFTLEVWAKPETTDGGYTVLMRGCFGFPKFFGDKDFDCYLVTAQNKNAGSRVYAPVAPGKYHYYVMTGDPAQQHIYYDGKLMRTNKGSGIPVYLPNVPLHIGNSIGWSKKNFSGAVGVVRIHNRALSAGEIKNNYALLQSNKALPQDKSLIVNADRRDLNAAAVEAALHVAALDNGLVLPGVEAVAAPDNAWSFPAKSGAVRLNNVPDWGKKGFTLEVWAKPATTDCGYAVLMRGSFGYPKFFGQKDFDCYFVPESGKADGGRIYTALATNQYHYYALSLSPDGGVAYYDGKAMRQYTGNCVPRYSKDVPLHIGNSIGWAKNFVGQVAVVRLHDRALSANEIAINNALLQKNLPLPDVIPAILTVDRRVTGNFYRFQSGQKSVLPAPDETGTVEFSVRPEVLSDCTLLQWGDLTLSMTANGDLNIKYGNFSSRSEKVFAAGKNTVLAFSRNPDYRYAAAFVDGKPVSQLIKNAAVQAPADMIFGGGFSGLIGQVKLSEDTLLPDKLGQTITVKLDNRNIDQTCYPLSRHLVGKKEEFVPVIDFSDLTGWTMSYTNGAVKPVITRSKEEPLWNVWVLRTEFAKGDFPDPNAKVVLTPPAPIKVNHDFDAIAMWRHATRFGKPYPALTYSIQYRDSSGKLHDTGGMGGMLEVGWGCQMKPLKNTVAAPSEIVSITFKGFNEAKRVTYFDSLHVYKRSTAPLTDARVMSWQELGIPTRPETILPSANEPGKTSLRQQGKSWVLESVAPSGKRLVFTVTPQTGTLGDITASYKNKTFKPMDGGGFYWALDNVYPVKPTSLLAPNSKRIKAELIKAQTVGNKLVLDWQYTIDNTIKYRANWTLQVKDNTLIADLKSVEPMVGEFKFGAVTGVSGKVVEIPYLTWGAWIRRSDPPGIFAGEDFYVSAYIDWYNSDASGLFGESSSTPGGTWRLNASTADHRWFPDADAKDKTNEIRDVSIINGGSYYWPKTDGVRNPARERIMLTVNDSLDAMLPNIPNPTHKYLQETVNDVWCTRQWYIRTLPMMDYFDRELAMWQELKLYGADEINMRLHGNVNRMYAPRHNGDPTTFIKSFTEPAIGGDEKMAWFFKEMKNMNYRIGIYTDHMLLSCMSDGWDRDKLNLDSNGSWLYSSDNDKQTKISRMVDLQKEYNAIYRKKFGPTCAYLDQITCPPCWRYTDYDARTPDAGKFSAVYRVFAESLRAEEADFGPVLSEGKTQLFFAGMCDSYAQPQKLNMYLLPNFNLRKLHMLSNDCGYHLSELGLFSHRKDSEIQAYKLLTYEHAYGNTGHLSGVYVEPYTPVPNVVLRSYFLIQPAQKYYALTPIKAILYNVNGKLVSVDEAIKAGTLNNNQIKLVYENGYEVAANMNPQSNFEVTLHGKKYVLPYCGFAGSLPGKVEFYSALNSKGERTSVMREGNLIYAVNPQDIEELCAKHDYALRTKGKTLELTPTPYTADETVSVKVPFSGKAKVTALDRAGKTLWSKIADVKNQQVAIGVEKTAFRYLIEQN
ncbi:MAG: hypothetical protein E7047_10150 [Lentisphaerae bacterium]|nr:hypothetical protein [Lentisphaerota bacterium]